SRGAQRLEERAGERLTSFVEELALRRARGRQPRRPDAPVLQARLDHDEPRRLERAEGAADVARVEAEPGAEQPHVAAVPPELPEEPGRAQRAVAREVTVVEGADALRDEPVEAAHLADRARIDSLILVRE